MRNPTAPATPDAIWFIQNLVRVIARGEDTGGRYSMLEMHAPPGDQPPLHVHADEDECFYVVEGEMSVWAGDSTHRLGPGDSVVAPRRVPHTYRVESAEGGRFLVSASPSFAAFVEAFGEPAPREELPHPDGPPDLERLTRIAAEHGIELLGPPGALP